MPERVDGGGDVGNGIAGDLIARLEVDETGRDGQGVACTVEGEGYTEVVGELLRKAISLTIGGETVGTSAVHRTDDGLDFLVGEPWAEWVLGHFHRQPCLFGHLLRRSTSGRECTWPRRTELRGRSGRGTVEAGRRSAG